MGYFLLKFEYACKFVALRLKDVSLNISFLSPRAEDLFFEKVFNLLKGFLI